MKSTTTTIEGDDLPENVIALEQAQAHISDDTLEETVSLCIENGYFLTGIEEHPFFGTQYELEKLEVEE